MQWEKLGYEIDLRPVLMGNNGVYYPSRWAPIMSRQNNKLNYYVVLNLLLTWVSPALSKYGAGYIPVIR